MIHLHCHSHYSTLDGLAKVEEIVAKAKEQKAPAVAVTDHGSLSALPDLIKECKAANIKPIVGCEFFVVDDLEDLKNKKRYHLTVWAKNWAGVKSIMKQLTLANKQFYKRPIITFDQANEFTDCMVGTACCFGVLSHDEAGAIVLDLQKAYGDDLYLEVMPHEVMIDGTDRQYLTNSRAVHYAETYDIKLLATNDSHYVNAEDAATHSVLMGIQYGKKVGGLESWPAVFYMRSIKEMAEAFKKIDYFPGEHIRKALLNTVELADKVDIVKPEFEVCLPDVHGDDSYLQRCVLEGWNLKVKGKVGKLAKKYHDRLVHELRVIKSMGFERYFMIVEDIIRWSRQQGIMVGPARGSAAGSLVCYLMDITQVDPIRHDLLFERFLNPDRVELPDIDVDFQDNRRGEVLEYMISKYGRECVGQINTFTSMSVKSAFRDVARVYDVNNLTVNILSKQIEDEASFEKVPELVGFAARNPEVITHVKKLNGTIRNTGVHACGICISERPLDEVCVMERRKEGVMVSSWDKRQCESFGLLKVDVLGLTTLSVLEHVRQLVIKSKGVDLDFTKIPLDDPATMKAFSEGDCAMVFQFEGDEMKKLLRRLKASDFETITAATALYRPGPLNAGLTDRYVRIAQGSEPEWYATPLLEPIMKPTKSVMVYQEQIMRVFTDLGGFTKSEADTMRKIIGKKLGEDEFNKHRVKFVEGCASNGIEASIAESLMNDMAEFAAYSFNKSHAAAYSMISVWTMYCKVHYAAEFMAAYMSCVHGEDSIVKAMAESKRQGVPVALPNINLSTDRYELDIETGAILAPLTCIKGVGTKAVNSILEARKDGVFFSKANMVERVNRRVVNIRVQDILTRAGAFESLGLREIDDVQRKKDQAELLPMFENVPQLTLAGNEPDLDQLAVVLAEARRYATTKHKDFIKPMVGGKRPSIMVISMPVKGEKNMLSKEGSRHLLNCLKRRGIPKSAVYGTSPAKTLYDPPSRTNKKCMAIGLEFLKKEIEVMRPKVIICCHAEPINLFVPGGKLAKLNGRVVYSKEHDAYVVFSYSPQFAFYQEERAGSLFNASMDKVAEMFIDRRI